MKRCLMIVLLLSCVVLLLPVQAQVERKIDPLKNYWGDVDGFLNRQSQATLDLIESFCERFPPALEEPAERRLMLHALDGVLHDPTAPERPPVQEFFHHRMAAAVEEMEGAKVEQGARLWKLYNHSFVVRTASVTIAFDLVSGASTKAEGFAVSQALLQRIIDQCDVLFISHRHGDHTEASVAAEFVKHGKPVIAPENAWEDDPLRAQVIFPKRDENLTQEVRVKGGSQVLRFRVFPGHQGELLNNVYQVTTPEGLSFVQTGDQSNSDDFAWIDGAGEGQDIDVLFSNCWTPRIARLVQGFDPKLLVTGHENELGHSVDHREPFWLTYDRLQFVDTPWLLMTWGESFHYDPSRLRAQKANARDDSDGRDRELFMAHLRRHFEDIHEVSMRFHKTDPSLGGLIVLETIWRGGRMAEGRVVENETGCSEEGEALLTALRKWEIPELTGPAELTIPFRIKLVGSDDPRFPEQAIVTGSVTDGAGKILSGARIVLTAVESGEETVPTAFSNREGIFIRTLVPPGTWRVSCELDRYVLTPIEPLRLARGEHAVLRLEMKSADPN